MWHYEADFGRQAVGWSGVGALPETGAAANVVDTDRDGQPGVTVLVDAPFVGQGEVWVAQVGRTQVAGVGDGDQIQGKVLVPELASNVLGASSSMLLNAPVVVFDPARSFFSMVRAQALRC